MFGLVALALSIHQITRLDGTHLSLTEADRIATNILKDKGVVGAQISIACADTPVWSYCYGLKHKGPDEPVDSHTTMWTASITKAMFATYFMKLVEEGKLSLDVPVAAQLSKPLDQYPSYHEKAPLLVQDPRWATVTPRMLMGYTSGLLNFASTEADGKMRLHFTPGAKFSYSTEGFNVLQVLVEEKTGKPLEEAMRAGLFDPLRMNRTGTYIVDMLEKNVSDRFGAKGEFLSKNNGKATRAGGSASSSSDDLVRLGLAILDGRYLGRKANEELLKPVVGIHYVHFFPWGPDEPEGYEARETGLASALGWCLLTHTKFGPAFFKEGRSDGCVTYMIAFQRSKTVIAIQTNSDTGISAMKPLLEGLIGDTVTPWIWEGYAN